MTILFWWSLFGIPCYQLTIIRIWYKRKEDRDSLTARDIIEAVPFGLAVLLVVILVKVLMDLRVLHYKDKS